MCYTKEQQQKILSLFNEIPTKEQCKDIKNFRATFKETDYGGFLQFTFTSEQQASNETYLVYTMNMKIDFMNDEYGVEIYTQFEDIFENQLYGKPNKTYLYTKIIL